MSSTRPLPASVRPVTPFLAWRPLVTRVNVKADALAGVTSAMVGLPRGVASATIAGMAPEYGLHAVMIPAVIAAVCGSAWRRVAGPTPAASIVLCSVLPIHADPGSADAVRLALTLTFALGLAEPATGLAPGSRTRCRNSAPKVAP